MQNQTPAEIDTEIAKLRAEKAALLRRLDQIEKRGNELDAVYRANPWTRYYPSVTSSNPHIHRSTSCRTLHYDTQMTWATQLSGMDVADAVETYDEALCSVCFPDAPVALHNYVSRKSQAEQAQRAAEKNERDAKKAAKTLTRSEQFRTEYGRDTVRTVAGCKDVIRRAVEQAVEIEWYDSPRARENWTADEESFQNLRRNISEHYVAMLADAEQAEDILIAREERTPGHGMTADDIAKMRENKYKAAKKEWFAN